MNRIILSVVAAAVLGIGGFLGFQQYQILQARRAEQARVAVQKARAAAEERARAADGQARANAEAARLQAQQAAVAALRLDVETQLRAMKVSSILPGQPGIAIIDKKSYEDGDLLPPTVGKRQARITAVRADGILLACEGQAFRLEPPPPPGLAVGAKGR